jgi:hypothetical protein
VGSRCAAVVLVLAGLLALTSTASATLSDTPDNIWLPNSTAFATARSADRIYVGGNFTRVAPQVGGFARFTGGSDQLLSSPPKLTLSSGAEAMVFSVVDDGAGGFFIGGHFDAVGGVARHELAHILADGSLDPVFAPEPDGQVTALERNGSTLYVAGSFTTIGGAARTHLAAVDGAGHATAWAPVLDATPNAIALSGSTVYLGGSFTTINGVARPNAGAVDATTGATMAWDPQPNNLVYRIAPAGASVFIGGAFTAVHGTSPVYYLAKVDATTGLPTSWIPTIHSTGAGGGSVISALAVSGSSLYVGGLFDMVDSTARSDAAAIDVDTAATLEPWNPNPGTSDGLFIPSVSTLAVSGSTVYLAGSFHTINGTVTRMNAAAVDATTGAATSWAPWLNADANGIALSGSSIGIAGGFGLAGGVPRNNVAALDAADGTATSWDPNVQGGAVRAIAPDGANIFLAGDFTTVGNAAHRGLAKVDTTTGLALSALTPDLSDAADVLVLAGRTLYVGGRFHGAFSVGSANPNYVAAIDADTEQVDAFAPNPDGDVTSIAVAGGTVYVSGDFTTLGGGATARSAAFAATTAGSVTSWNPGVGPAGPLATFGSSVFLAGSFAGPTGLETVDGTSAAPIPPAVAVAANTVHSLATDGASVFVGGSFGTLDGQPRAGLAAIDPTSGLLSAWHPVLGMSLDVTSLSVDGRGGVLTLPDFASFSALPQATSAPALSASLTVGQPATCANGSWSGSIPQRYGFAWLRDGVVIAGGASYAPAADDAGHALACRVTATNLGGSTIAESAGARVAAAAPAQGGGTQPPAGGGKPDTTRPAISSLKLSPSTFVAFKRGASITTAKKPGTAVSYRVSEAATVVFTVQRRTAGRRSGRACVKATKRLRTHKACTRYVAVKGSFARAVRAKGAYKLRFSGRLGGHTLSAAHYRLRLIATDRAKNHSPAATVAFAVKRR